jgi:hypothetical protein
LYEAARSIGYAGIEPFAFWDRAKELGLAEEVSNPGRGRFAACPFQAEERASHIEDGLDRGPDAGPGGPSLQAGGAIPRCLKGGVKCAIIFWCTVSSHAGTPPAARCPGGSLPLKRTAPGAGTVPWRTSS